MLNTTWQTYKEVWVIWRFSWARDRSKPPVITNVIAGPRKTTQTRSSEECNPPVWWMLLYQPQDQACRDSCQHPIVLKGLVDKQILVIWLRSFLPGSHRSSATLGTPKLRYQTRIIDFKKVNSSANQQIDVPARSFQLRSTQKTVSYPYERMH